MFAAFGVRAKSPAQDNGYAAAAVTFHEAVTREDHEHRANPQKGLATINQVSTAIITISYIRAARTAGSSSAARSPGVTAPTAFASSSARR